MKKIFHKSLTQKTTSKQFIHHNQKEIYNNFTKNLEVNIQNIKVIFDRSSDIIFREFLIGGTQKAALIYMDGLVNTEMIDSNVLKPLIHTSIISSTLEVEVMSLVENQIIAATQVNIASEIEKSVDGILTGETLLIIDGIDQVMLISLKEWDKRSIEEPATESVIRGPREGFTENLRTNTVLLRRRLKTPHLKMEMIKLGTFSKTDIVITYIEGIANKELIDEVRKRLSQINIDAILESGYIEELIEDNSYSFFPQAQYTERPDKLSACLLEGHVGIIIDNTPFALIAPITFFQMMNASEDYYQRSYVTTFIRWIRYVFLCFSLMLPSLYIAITTFHQEMIPSTLLLNIASSRETVPFPAIVEAILMEITFEALREAGVRLPRPVGQAVSIVGALVIGQAAVEAGLVSAPMIIVVALTGISSFTTPSYALGNTIRILRFPLMFLGGTLGLFGVFTGMLLILIHMCRLSSLGFPYLSPLAPFQFEGLKDVLIREVWKNKGLEKKLSKKLKHS